MLLHKYKSKQTMGKNTIKDKGSKHIIIKEKESPGVSQKDKKPEL